jgi:single-stranded DNA-binding protein
MQAPHHANALVECFKEPRTHLRKEIKMENKKTKQTQPQTEAIEKLFTDTNVSMKTGRLVYDAEVIGNGKFAKIRIASNKQYLDKDKNVKSNVNYFNALVSSNLTNAFGVAKDLKKGDWVYLKGEDNTQGFDTPEGYKKTETTIFAYKVVLKKEKQNGEVTPVPQ